MATSTEQHPTPTRRRRPLWNWLLMLAIPILAPLAVLGVVSVFRDPPSLPPPVIQHPHIQSQRYPLPFPMSPKQRAAVLKEKVDRLETQLAAIDRQAKRLGDSLQKQQAKIKAGVGSEEYAEHLGEMLQILIERRIDVDVDRKYYHDAWLEARVE